MKTPVTDTIRSLDAAFPQSEPGFRSPDGFYKSDATVKCRGCEQNTHWFHMGILLSFCSHGCYDRFMKLVAALDNPISTRRAGHHG